ncbi:Coenzyme F420 hydrogenase/dehydrogenase, beta subunit C-terminal domain [Methanobrevibacter sp. DSM 116169]|uniref:Coenzyme F420 hydrogenase/dehydrogenase, beta subunit C-terminal domain n=1 Tax=Methanobrevibacter sp. DSM 116169 TaxID=3242727 RepID=UPI0038FC4EDC
MSVKVNDKFYAYSNNEDIANKGEYGGVVTTIMKHLLEENIVDGVVAVKKASDLYDAVPTVITDPEEIIKSAGSIHFGTLNVAKFLSKYLDGARDMKLAVACKPCDAKSLRELMKKGKVIEDNVVMVGINCGGTFNPVPSIKMIKDVYELDPEKVQHEEISKGNLIIGTSDGKENQFSIDELEEEGMGRRTNCQRCSMKIPFNADLALGNWGVIGPLAGKATFVEVFSDKGADILESVIASDKIKTEEPIEKGIAIREKIAEVMSKGAEKQKAADFEGTTGDIIDILHKYSDDLSKCMKCYGCREACPLCYCEDCCLEAEGPEWVPGGYTPAAPFYHLTRFVHIADVCTNCGQCEDVCPSEIPVSKILATINNKVTETFGYIPGVDSDDKLPFTEYQKSK